MSAIRKKKLSPDEIEAIFDEIPCDDGDDTEIESDNEDNDTENGIQNDENEILSQLIDEILAETPENIEDNNETQLYERPEIRVQWKNKEKSTDVEIFISPEGPVAGFFENMKSPTEFFMFYIEPVVEGIIFQSNLYATQKNKTLNLNKNEFYAFIGINFFMGYNQLPSWRHYWSTSEDLATPIVSKTMSRQRFDSILRFLHVNDNSKIPSNNTDRLFKIRPMIESLNQRFQQVYHGTKELSVDESMILFKGRNAIKQYCPMKPIKRGYKLWCLADQHGYIKKFSIYQGKDETVEEKYEGFGLGERVVLSLTEAEWGKNKYVYFDNYFTSIKLLEFLKTQKVFACGTIRANRKGLPVNLRTDKQMKRGEFDSRVTTNGIIFFKWKDNKAISLASNFHGTEKTTVQRRDRSGKQINIECPTVVKDYNSFMGGVDHADQLRSAYGLGRRSKKWWHRLFWGLLEIAFINSYIVYCQTHEKISLLDYRRSVAQGLMTQKDVGANKRSLSHASKPPNKKRRGKTESVVKDVRLGNLGVHWPIFTGNRGRCEMCSIKKIQSKPTSKCQHCGVFLCCNDKKNCFAAYHGIGI